MEDGTVTVRRYGTEKQQTMGMDAFQSMLRDEIRYAPDLSAEA